MSHNGKNSAISGSDLFSSVGSFRSAVFSYSFSCRVGRSGFGAGNQSVQNYAFESSAPNSAAVSYRIPNMGIKSLIFGGLISPLQVSILENGQPLPVVLCGFEQFKFDNQNCYAVQSGRIYFSSSDGSFARENGSLYQICLALETKHVPCVCQSAVFDYCQCDAWKEKSLGGTRLV
ncbi:MAG: hypothetical protein IPL71_06590 [Anaerolineales bacterium]|uniref:hypothetical protein n=1 Tax=Candidatus Villigracilis proximus TaxID=3140683 RepID=UPI003136396B|nr:hypothetical protein [Anaerolineales bacterium]